MSKITEEHIEKLYRFTRSHFVEHYDLQTELVDHLANGIELQCEVDPKLSFDEALHREFKKFGVFGFQDVIKERKKAMSKRYRGIVWGYFKTWWSIPKIILTLGSILIVFSALRLLPSGDMKLEIVFGSFLVLALLSVYRTIKLKREMDGQQRKWMLQDMIFNLGALIQVFIFPLHFLNLSNSFGILESFYGQAAISVLFVAVFILFMICGYVIPKRAEELLAQTYPEYNLVE